MKKIEFLVENKLAKNFEEKLMENGLSVQDYGIEMIKSYLSENTDSFGIPTMEDSPIPTKSDVDHFWKTNNAFKQMAEHLMKISLYPKHRDQQLWRISVFNQLVLILRKTSDRSLSSDGKKSKVKKLHKTAEALTKRINSEINNVFDTVQIKMAPSLSQRRNDLLDFNTVKELGFTVTSYYDLIYGWNYRVISNKNELIADTNERNIA